MLPRPTLRISHHNHTPLPIHDDTRAVFKAYQTVAVGPEHRTFRGILERQKRIRTRERIKRGTRQEYVTGGIHRDVTADIRSEGRGSEVVGPDGVAVHVIFDGYK